MRILSGAPLGIPDVIKFATHSDCEDGIPASMMWQENLLETSQNWMHVQAGHEKDYPISHWPLANSQKRVFLNYTGVHIAWMLNHVESYIFGIKSYQISILHGQMLKSPIFFSGPPTETATLRLSTKPMVVSQQREKVAWPAIFSRRILQTGVFLLTSSLSHSGTLW